MKSERNYIKVIIDEKGRKQQEDGHPWVYDNEIIKIEGSYENGDIVDVLSQKGKYLGSGFINNNSKIMIRIISRNANDNFDEAFFERRIKYAWDYLMNMFGLLHLYPEQFNYAFLYYVDKIEIIWRGR